MACLVHFSNIEENRKLKIRLESDECLDKHFGLDGLGDIQVLSPLYRGPAGVTILNERLQEKLNPPANGKVEKSLYGTIFRVGDKVMQTCNNYDKNVYNGDIGFVQGIDMVN